MVSICLCILWGLMTSMLMPNKPAGLIVSMIGAVLITVVCIKLGIK